MCCRSRCWVASVANDAEALEDWASKERGWLSGFLQLPHGIPTQDVFLRALAAIDPAQFRDAFTTWMQEIFTTIGVRGQIAVDGQTNRGSRARATHRSPVHMVSALSCAEGLVLGQTRTDEKSNEFTALPALLGLLDLRGALVSIDAIGCQVAIAKLQSTSDVGRARLDSCLDALARHQDSGCD
jgi:hypothetical protein